MSDGPAERPVILVLLIRTKPPYQTAVVDLLEVSRYLRNDYMVVIRDPFTVDEWRRWRAKNPEAA